MWLWIFVGSCFRACSDGELRLLPQSPSPHENVPGTMCDSSTSGCAGDGLRLARLELWYSVPCCLLPPPPGLLCLGGLASGPLLLGLSFNSPLPISARSIPNLTNLHTWTCSQPPAAHSTAHPGVSLGSAACLGALLPCDCHQGPSGSLTHQGTQGAAPSTETRCCLPQAEPGSPLLLPHGPPPSKTSAHPGVHHYCCHVLHRPCSRSTCLNLLPAGGAHRHRV